MPIMKHILDVLYQLNLDFEDFFDGHCTPQTKAREAGATSRFFADPGQHLSPPNVFQ